MLSKKGMAEDIKNILLVLAGFVVVVLILVSAFGTAEDILKHKLCNWSLVFKDKFIIGTNLCYTDDIEISSKDKNEVIKEVSDDMVECWERMEEGRVSIDSSFIFGNYKCFKCYRAKITNLKDTITYNDFYSFLINNKPEGKDETYYNFFKIYGKDNQVLLVGYDKNLDGIFIDPGKTEYYAIAFKGYSTPVSGGTAAVAAGVIKFVKGAYTLPIIAVYAIEEGIRYYVSENSIIVSPYDNMRGICSDTIR